MHEKRRIQLPSGKIVEIELFDSTPPRQPENPCSQFVAGLHICHHCKGKRVLPVEWEEYDLTHWKVLSRCPDCDMWRTEIAHQSACDLWDEELDDAMDKIRDDYRRLVMANMAEEVERFIQALDADAILPIDF